MLNRKIPSTGELLPVIGLGTWQQFDVEKNDAVITDLSKVLTLMKDSGARMIDSSPMYGRSEIRVGDLTAGSNDFFYATKVWISGKANGIKQMKESMQKMQRPVMDLMQVHNLLDVSIHLKTLREWKEEGLIRYIGVTHYTVDSHPMLEKIIDTEILDFIQFNYSIARRNAEKTLLNAALDKDIAVIINEPLEKGALFSKVRDKKIPQWAIETGITNWSCFFLKYIISHPAVTCVIPGTSNPIHMSDILSAGEGDMPDDALKKKMVDFFEDL